MIIYSLALLTAISFWASLYSQKTWIGVLFGSSLTAYLLYVPFYINSNMELLAQAVIQFVMTAGHPT